MKTALLAALFTGVAALVAMPVAGEEPRPHNIILVSIDTLRGDHLGCYGYARPTSPRIDAFAAKAVRYTRAIASSPWTLPTHASMFTGQAPFEHQAHIYLERGKYNVHGLPVGRVTLAEALADLGYDTAAFAANQAFLGRHWHLDQGFAIYNAERVGARAINARAWRWLEERRAGKKEKPFFLFLNYMETHRPYAASPQPAFISSPVAPDEGAALDQLQDIVMPAMGPVPAELAQRVIDQYDAAIANLDAALGEFLRRLEKDGRFEDTIIVLTSDHGEYFGEHHLVEHAKDIYQPVVAVPLLIRGPALRSGRTDDLLVDSSDIPGLIAMQLPSPVRDRLVEKFPLKPGAHPVISEMHYALKTSVENAAWGHRLRRIRQALFEGPWKYIHSSDGSHELYDLSRDPAETDNLIKSRPEIAADLARKLEQWLTSRRPAAPPAPLEELDEEDLKRLKSLGYID